MSAAIGTLNFSSNSVFIRQSLDRIGEVIIKGRPAAPGIKLCFCGKQGIITLTANISSASVELIIFPGKRRLRPLSFNNLFFFRS